MDPLKKYHVFGTSACARRTGAAARVGQRRRERMHNTLSHRSNGKQLCACMRSKPGAAASMECKRDSPAAPILYVHARITKAKHKAVCAVCMHSKDSRCHTRDTRSRPPCQAHVSRSPRLQQHQPCSRTLQSQSGRLIIPATSGYLGFGPVAQCVVHALKGLACRASLSRAR